MRILTGFSDGRLRISPEGELDHHAAKGPMRDIDGIIDEYLPNECIVDMGKLSFMDSSGIAIILRVQKRMNEIGGKAWVENPCGQPLRVIDASGIDRIIRVYGVEK